jgi:hypothetical protein
MKTLDSVNPEGDGGRLISHCREQRITPQPRGHLSRVVARAFAKRRRSPTGAER